jgi:hypothetical protein
MPILLILAALTNLVCWIIILVKLFKNGDTVTGVIGIFCGLVAYIVGWTKSDELDSTKVMLVWTVAIIAQVAITFSIQSGAVPAQ